MNEKHVEARMKSRIAEVLLKHGRRMSPDLTQEIVEACVEVWSELNTELSPEETVMGFPYAIDVELSKNGTLSVTLSLEDPPETDLDSV